MDEPRKKGQVDTIKLVLFYKPHMKVNPRQHWRIATAVVIIIHIFKVFFLLSTIQLKVVVLDW